MTPIIRLFFIVCICGTTWQLTMQASVASRKSFYTAGVVEFRPAFTAINDPIEQVNDNVRSYVQIIGSDEANETDIIVFPESTLNNILEATFVPDPRLQLRLCDNADGGVDNESVATDQYSDFLVQLACEAKRTSKYVVVNIAEKETCPSDPMDTRPCAPNGLNIFNTNVVFDRVGAIVSRYRKVNLYGEKKNTTLLPEYGTFDTDFGVRFAQFICFDILFYTPAQANVEQHGIRDFIMSSMWFSQLPFLTGVQTQSAWAYANDVNLLAAGASNPQVGSSGTGIYAGRKGALTQVMNTLHGQRQLYVARVPIHETTRRIATRVLPAPGTLPLAQSEIFLKRDHLQNYESIALDLRQGNSLKRELCFNGTSFCCHFDLAWQFLESATSDSLYYSFRLGAYAGWRNPTSLEKHQIKNCALFSCIGNSIWDCGKLFPNTVDDIRPHVAFTRILIEATYPHAEEFLLMPNSLRDDLLPLPVSNFVWNQTSLNGGQKVSFLMNTTTDNLLTFAIYGNYFDNVANDAHKDNDAEGSRGGGSTALGVPLTCLIVLSLVATTII